MKPASAVNLRLVKSRVADVRRSLGRLRELRKVALDRFLADPDMFAIAERHLRRLLEALFDAGRHIIARSGLGVASDYADVPRLLAESHILSKTTALELRTLARLRNRLVHFYWQVTAAEMHNILNQRLSHIEACCRELLAWCVAQKSEES